uniref:Guanylin n=1 Tax=Laticauda laticaudata TaxID=8630 RepID=A0A8C5SEQ7_LATLA
RRDNHLPEMIQARNTLFFSSYPTQVQNLSFSWDSVKALKKVLDVAPQNPRPRSRGPAPVCLHPELPHEFVPLCFSPKGADVFRTLVSHIDDGHCELSQQGSPIHLTIG